MIDFVLLEFSGGIHFKKPLIQLGFLCVHTKNMKAEQGSQAYKC